MSRLREGIAYALLLLALGALGFLLTAGFLAVAQ